MFVSTFVNPLEESVKLVRDHAEVLTQYVRIPHSMSARMISAEIQMFFRHLITQTMQPCTLEVMTVAPEDVIGPTEPAVTDRLDVSMTRIVLLASIATNRMETTSHFVTTATVIRVYQTLHLTPGMLTMVSVTGLSPPANHGLLPSTIAEILEVILLK